MNPKTIWNFNKISLAFFYKPKNIINRFKHIVEDAVRSRDLSLSERKKITQSFKDSISGYTYFEK